MKKLLRNIILLLVPILLYTGLFLYLEPNNFYGLRRETPSGAIFGALRQQKESPANAIIVGDSRLAHIPMETARAASGIPFANLAYGGASVAEQVELVEWMLAEYPDIDTVVFELSFYTLNDSRGQSRIKSVQEAMRNPFLYLTNFSYHMEVLNLLPAWLAGQPLYGGEHETENPADYTYAEYEMPGGRTVPLRETVGSYLVNPIEGILREWAFDTEAFAGTLALIDACTASGIRFVVVMPPMHPALKEYIVDYYGITDVMLGTVEALRQTGAEVYDYEFTQIPDYADDRFYDGLHLDYFHGLAEWTQTFFEELQ